MHHLLVLAAVLVPSWAALMPVPAPPSLSQVPPHASKLIIGGNDAPDYNWPWQASVQYPVGTHKCGASLLNERWLITSAQCIVKNKIPREYTIVLGMRDVTMARGKPEIYAVDKIVVHPAYTLYPDNGSADFDVALIHVSEDIEMNEYTAPIQVPSTTENPEGLSNCWTTGWGYTTEGPIEKLSNNLQEASVNVYTSYECNRRIANSQYWDPRARDHHLCAGKNNLASVCNGDTGGPLACKVNGKWKLHGVTSWFHPTCVAMTPSVFTRITHPSVRAFISAETIL